MNNRYIGRDVKRDHNAIYTTLYRVGKPINSVKLDRAICNIIVLLNEQQCYTVSSCQRISFGVYGGLSWIQFESPIEYQRLLNLAIGKKYASEFLSWLCGGLSPNRNESYILCKPLMTGSIRIDMYFNPSDIPFFEESLVSLKKIKSKL